MVAMPLKLNMIPSRGLKALLLVGMLLIGMAELPCFAQDVLRGRLHQDAEVDASQLHGVVLDSQTGVPLSGAKVSVPDTGAVITTDKLGGFAFSQTPARKPFIMSVEKQGYAPFSVTISETVPLKLTVQLQKQFKSLVLDTQLRHLGDNSYGRDSNGASLFKKKSDGPAIRIPFSISGLSLSEKPYLQVGSIIGIDTQLSHVLVGNLDFPHASPLLIKLNGTVVARVQVNGDNQKIYLPTALLKLSGVNNLELEAGYHYPEPNRIDYDDMELMYLVFYP